MAVTTTNLGVITAYGDAVAAGYTGTKAEWQALMASYATVGQQAVDAKNAAVAAKNTAVSKATEATTAANTATTKASEASASAQGIAQSASQIAQNTSDISELKEDLTALAPKEDMLKSFPTDTASGAVASFADGANVPVKSLIVNIDLVQSGSGDPSPTNVRPISGWGEVNVNVCGINVWNEEWEAGSINSNNGTNYPSTNNIRSKNYIPVVGASTYYIKAPNGAYIFGYDNNKNYVGRVPNSNAQMNTIFDVPVGTAYIKFYVRDDYGTTYNHDISINYPSTDHDYHPYSGQSINIALGQTVYGGKLDVTKGKLTIDIAMADLGTLNWVSEDSEVSGLARADVRNMGIIYYSTPICSKFKGVAPKSYVDIGESEICFSNSESLPLIRVKWSELSGKTNAEIIEALTGVQFCYLLVTPLTIQLDPVSVSALYGNSNIWADTGDNMVEYRVDPTLYIQRLTEPDADMIADANITSGSYFMVGNTLYKATANIASGATISPNVNCTRKSLSEALNELNA